jgi:hypothetical protein
MEVVYLIRGERSSLNICKAKGCVPVLGQIADQNLGGSVFLISRVATLRQTLDKASRMRRVGKATWHIYCNKSRSDPALPQDLPCRPSMPTFAAVTCPAANEPNIVDSAAPPHILDP